MLRAAVQSVLAQSAPAREIVVVDDGSTDHTLQVVHELAASGAPITLLLNEQHQNRRGEARNRGVAATTAPVVAFLDSDDLWLPERLERQLDLLSKAPLCGFGFCNLRRFHDGVGNDCAEPPFLAPGADYNGFILGDLLEEALALSSTLVVRRAAFERVGGFSDLRMNEDYELTLRLANAYPASYLPEPLALIREHPSRTSYTHGDLPLQDHLGIVSRFLSAHPDLPPTVRARGRNGLANVNFKLARLYLERGEGGRARQHLLALLKLRPWDRRAPGAYLRSFMPAH